MPLHKFEVYRAKGINVEVSEHMVSKEDLIEAIQVLQHTIEMLKARQETTNDQT